MNHPTLRHGDLADIAKHLDHRNYQDDGERVTDVLPALINAMEKIEALEKRIANLEIDLNE